MKVFRDENGQMLVFTALTMTALLGFLALATDVGTLFRARRQLQIAADAAATTGAVDVLYNNANYVADAKAAASANGANSASGATVTVNSKPLSGFHQTAGYVEVIITQPNPTFFMKLFGVTSMNISARAVAGPPTASKYCGYLMDPTGVDLQLQGNSSISSSGCAWYINSNGNNSAGQTINVTGGAATVTAPYVSVVGSNATGIQGTTVYPDSVAQSPPDIQSTGFTPSDCTSTNPTPKSGTIDGGDGVVCFTGSNVDLSGLTLQNGVFLFEKGVSVGVTATTTVNDATIEVYGGSFNQSTNSNFNIEAPKPADTNPADTNACATCVDEFCGSGANNCLNFNGVALLVPAANTNYNDTTACQSVQHGNVGSSVLQVQTGSSNQLFDGFIVAPLAEVFLNDHGGGNTYSGLYAACLFGKASVINVPSYNAEHPYTTPLRVVSLVE